jgi:hypothetical protein
MAIPSAQVVADRWANATSTGSQRYLDGVAQTDIDVVGRAIAAKGALVNNFNNAVNNGTWERRLGAVGTQGWKASVAAKGGQAYTNGVTAAKAKFQQRMGLVLQYEAGLQSQIQSMPSGSPAANDARMLAWSNGMRQAKASGAFG